MFSMFNSFHIGTSLSANLTAAAPREAPKKEDDEDYPKIAAPFIRAAMEMLELVCLSHGMTFSTQVPLYTDHIGCEDKVLHIATLGMLHLVVLVGCGHDEKFTIFDQEFTRESCVWAFYPK